MSVKRPSLRLTRVLAMAATAAMLAAALPAGAVVMAKADGDCKVHNLGKAIDRNSLQKAVRVADPGDALLVQGTCAGTTLIDKDLDISFMGWAGAPMPLGSQYVVSPESRVTGGGAGPALVIDSGVDHFTVNPGLLVADGIVIGEADAWDASVPSMVATITGHSLGDCHLRNDETAEEYERSQEALDAAAPSAQLSLRGACTGETVVGEATRVAGWRIAISSLTLGGEPAGAEDSGPATLASVSVDAGVDDLVLRDVQVTDGFRITELTPAT